MKQRYILESGSEAERLERQALASAYSFKDELRTFEFRSNSRVLDAGCGSGVVSRYLSQEIPNCSVVGVDVSSERIRAAKDASHGFRNVEFKCADLAKDAAGEGEFDYGICRYVLEHIPAKKRAAFLANTRDSLKPGGRLYAVDVDGILSNLYPMSPFVRRVISKIEKSPDIDLFVGRKLHQEFVRAGFESVDWRIKTLQFRGNLLKDEIELMRERLSNMESYLSKILGSRTLAGRFQRDYLADMQAPGATLFYNMFFVSAERPSKQIKLAG